MSSELSSKAGRERTALATVPLLVLHLVLLSLQLEDSSGALLFRRWTMAGQAPLVALSSHLTGGVKHLWTSYLWTVGARSENAQLRESLKRLSLLNQSYEQIRQENVRLRRLLSLSDARPFQTIGARVIARTPSFLANVMYIDRGADDGIRPDAPVLSGSGIVGRTTIVSGRQAQVQLITNPDAAMGVMLEKSRIPGVLKGSGGYQLDLNFISNTEPVANGETVLSSGLDGVFPKGLVIGKVVDSRKGRSVFRSIKVQPSMDLIRLEEVSVIIGESAPDKHKVEMQ